MLIIYFSNHFPLLHASTISANAGFKDAPPTKNPSISGFLIKSEAFLSVTEPP